MYAVAHVYIVCIVGYDRTHRLVWRLIMYMYIFVVGMMVGPGFGCTSVGGIDPEPRHSYIAQLGWVF